MKKAKPTEDVMNFFSYKAHSRSLPKLKKPWETDQSPDLSMADLEDASEELQAAIRLRMERQRHSDFYQRLNELSERIHVFNDMFLNKQPRYMKAVTKKKTIANGQNSVEFLDDDFMSPKNTVPQKKTNSSNKKRGSKMYSKSSSSQDFAGGHKFGRKVTSLHSKRNTLELKHNFKKGGSRASSKFQEEVIAEVDENSKQDQISNFKLDTDIQADDKLKLASNLASAQSERKASDLGVMENHGADQIIATIDERESKLTEQNVKSLEAALKHDDKELKKQEEKKVIVTKKLPATTSTHGLSSKTPKTRYLDKIIKEKEEKGQLGGTQTARAKDSKPKLDAVKELKPITRTQKVNQSQSSLHVPKTLIGKAYGFQEDSPQKKGKKTDHNVSQSVDGPLIQSQEVKVVKSKKGAKAIDEEKIVKMTSVYKNLMQAKNSGALVEKTLKKEKKPKKIFNVKDQSKEGAPEPTKSDEKIKENSEPDVKNEEIAQVENQKQQEVAAQEIVETPPLKNTETMV